MTLDAKAVVEQLARIAVCNLEGQAPNLTSTDFTNVRRVAQSFASLVGLIELAEEAARELEAVWRSNGMLNENRHAVNLRASLRAVYEAAGEAEKKP